MRSMVVLKYIVHDHQQIEIKLKNEEFSLSTWKSKQNEMTLVKHKLPMPRYLFHDCVRVGRKQNAPEANWSAHNWSLQFM